MKSSAGCWAADALTTGAFAFRWTSLPLPDAEAKRLLFTLRQHWRTKELSEALGVPIFDTQIVDREAFRVMFSFGGSLAGLAGKGMSGLMAALANAHAFAQELVDRLRNGVESASEAA
jgi:hypothetical protein